MRTNVFLFSRNARDSRCMNRCARFCLFFVVAITLPAGAAAQVSGDTAVALPIRGDRTIAFDTDEGTWISLDVSPDGRTIVFDLVGDLYLLPIEGGEARRITSGIAWDCMPRFSPDGRQVAFISDRSGSDNLWVMNVDGTALRQVTKETDFALSSPEWTPDGDYLVTRKFGAYPGPVDYLRSVPLWIYHKDGGNGLELFPAGAGGGGLTTNTGAAFSPDGRYAFFSSHTGGYAGEEVNRYQIVRFDRQTGDRQNLTTAYGGGLRPVVSPDGRRLVYATRVDARTALRIRDLETHEERWLVAEVQRDDQEGYAPNDIFPSYSFTHDSRAVVYTHEGRIKRVDVATNQIRVIPFSAHVEQRVATRHRVPLRIDDGAMPVRQLLGVAPSPDGRRLAFSAVGHLHTTDVGGTPRRATNEAVREYMPAFSPDGQWIAYVTWSDSAGGHVMKMPAGGGAPVRLTDAAGYYQSPVWSDDGARIAYSAATVRAGQGAPNSGASELRWVSANGGPQQRIATGVRGPMAMTGRGDSTRVWAVQAGGGGTSGTPTGTVVSMDLGGNQRRSHVRFSSPGAGGITAIPSPDERHLFILDRDDAYVMAMTPAGSDGLSINLGSPSVPLRRVTTEGANYIAWTGNGQNIAWSFADRFHTAPLAAVMAAEERSTWNVDTTTIALSVPRASPTGSLVLRGARVITMRGDEVLERADILIENNRIRAVGSSVQAPANARVIDVAGATIIPGLIDVHAHPRVGREVANDQEWSIAINLAYGVTTTRNPSGGRGSFPWGELVDAGEMIGSRVFATGPPLTSTNTPIRSAEDAVNAVRRYKQQGANSLKQYLQPRRIQRQWLLEAAKAENINITNEGAGDLKADVTMALDGFTAFEHTLPIVPIFNDLVQVFAQTKITYTPAMIASYGGPSSQDFWRAEWDMHGDAKLRRFTPHNELDSYGRRRPLIIEEDYMFDDIAAGARDILRAGGNVGLGSHGNQQGLGAQWEMWNLAMGGMTPMEVLRVSTIVGAESIGFERDMGSIEAGKLADLVVLDANPLDDIRNTNRIRYVIKNGFVHDGDTLDEVWPSQRAFPKPFWVLDDEALERLRGGR
jgi:Tol biopolymer transport system component/imidazolonepropionase-like amidohydrolase